jgi:hypothetical protein
LDGNFYGSLFVSFYGFFCYNFLDDKVVKNHFTQSKTGSFAHEKIKCVVNLSYGDDFLERNMNQEAQNALEAAAFRRLLQHLDARKDVQNIDMMIQSGFCRNCLSKWLLAAADDQGVDMDYDQAREHVYGMPYSEWKDNHQLPATEEQLAAMNALTAAKQK